jgi:hypothetical protein
MIDFDCPECGEPMQIGDRMAGREIRCVRCDEWVEVPHSRRRERPRDDRDRDDDPERDRDDRPPRKKNKSRRVRETGLSPPEWILFPLVFLIFPGINVIASSILYYVWRSSQPTRATQINLLGFGSFIIHLGITVIIVVLRSHH